MGTSAYIAFSLSANRSHSYIHNHNQRSNLYGIVEPAISRRQFVYLHHHEEEDHFSASSGTISGWNDVDGGNIDADMNGSDKSGLSEISFKGGDVATENKDVTTNRVRAIIAF